MYITDEIYSTHLKVIKGVSFTSREIDVISCTISGRTTKGAAHFLSVSPKTVEAHLYNAMRKMGVSSRDGVISFIENSNTLVHIRQHYDNLVVQAAFANTLKNISNLQNKPKKSCDTMLCSEKILTEQLLSKLRKDLEMLKSFKDVSVAELDLQNSPLKDENDTSLRFLITPETKTKDSEVIDVSGCKSYYEAVFKIIAKVLGNNEVEKLYQEFKSTYQTLLNNPISTSAKSEKTQPSTPIKNFKSVITLGGAGILSVLILCIYFLYNPNLAIRSELPLPNKVAFLDRSAVITKINEKYQSPAYIKTVVLVGIGGAGKTTIARQYGRSQTGSVIWEINAETKESLLNSMNSLAYAVSATEEDKKELRGIQNLKDPEEREKNLLYYVKKQLSANPGWLLIYDNIETFAKVQRFFPLDAKAWGRGRVLITTRDQSIKNNSFIDPNTVIKIGKLDQVEQLSLFVKILSPNNANQKIYINEAKEFLQHIPLFPLDVSVAAYYIKATGISYSKYLDLVANKEKALVETQETLLKSVNNYTKTRYAIITLAVKRLIDLNPEYKDLLVLISLLDSQKIPLDLLVEFKGDILIGQFIQDLQKQSLITMDPTTSKGSPPTISMHRSTQEICLAYLKEHLELDKNHQIIKSVIALLEGYTADAIYNRNNLKIKHIVSHIQRFLSHDEILLGADIGSITAEYGHIYAILGDYKKSEQLLNESIKINNALYSQNNAHVANSLRYLGYLKIGQGDYKHAQKLLEQTLAIYDLAQRKDYKKIAWTLNYLSYAHKFLGEYGKAKVLIHQCLDIHKKHLDMNHVQAKFALGFLGVIYKCIGNYTKAKDYLEQFILDLNEHKGEYKAFKWYAFKELGDVYTDLGMFEKAHNNLTQSADIMREIYKKGHFAIGWTLVVQGRAYRKAGDYARATKIYDQVLQIYKDHYGDDHLETATVLFHQAKVALLENHLDVAEQLYNKSLRVFEKEGHSKRYRILQHLSDLFLKKSELARANDLQQSLVYKKQAISYLQQSLAVVQASFPKDSPCVQRIETNLKALLNEKYSQSAIRMRF